MVYVVRVEELRSRFFRGEAQVIRLLDCRDWLGHARATTAGDSANINILEGNHSITSNIVANLEFFPDLLVLVAPIVCACDALKQTYQM
jgi:hypothetical protein